MCANKFYKNQRKRFVQESWKKVNWFEKHIKAFHQDIFDEEQIADYPNQSSRT